MSNYARLFAVAICFALALSAVYAQVNKNDTKIPPEKNPPAGVQSENDQPRQFDMLMRVEEKKSDTAVTNQVTRAMMARLNTSGLAPRTDYNMYVSHDTIQVRFLDNARSYKDWEGLLARQGLMQVHLTNDSIYSLKVDSTRVPKGYVILPEIDQKTTHYVSNQVLNGNLVRLQSSIEKFDEPTLTGVIMPRDTQFQSFLFTKGMRLVVVVDGFIFNTAVVTADSVALNTFPLLQQLPAALTFVMDRAIRFPLAAPVELIRVAAVKEERQKQ